MQITRPLFPRRFAAAAALAAGLAAPAASAQGQSERCDGTLGSWRIQLDDITVDGIRRAPGDLFIVDTSRNGLPAQQFSRDEVAAMKTGKDGQRRLVLAYLSIGQAEIYRGYWQEEWAASPPGWLDVPDAYWHDNYEVRYWDEDWQSLVYGSPGALLDTVLDLGFDGAMLDGVDAFEIWAGRRARAASDMVAFVRTLARHARARDPQFLLFPLNAENLLPDPDFAAVIDGIVKEDLFFGQHARPRPNDRARIDWAQARLKLAQDRALPVLVLEYLPEGATRQQAAARIDAAGYLGSFADRALTELSDAHPAASGAITSLKAGAACREE